MIATAPSPERKADPKIEAQRASDVNMRSYDDASESSADAESSLDLTEDAYLHFPWPSLDRAVGGIGPNRIVLLAAPPEGGKTSFTLSLLDEWANDGVRITAAFLETPPDEVIKQWACFRLGISYEDIGTGAFLRWPNVEEVRAAIRSEIREMTVRFCHHVWLHGMQALTASSVDALFRDALNYDSDVLFVDHLDHTDDTGNGARGLVESNAILSATKRGIRTAKAAGSHMRFFGTSQMNNDAVRRGGVFGRCQPPLPSDVFMGQRKEQITDLMLGLHRIRRPAQEGDTAIEKDIKEGRRALDDLLLPNTMGVRIMKRRLGGRSNITVPLGFRRGRVIEPNTYSPRQDRSPDDVYDVS